MTEAPNQMRPYPKILGESPQIKELISMIGKVGASKTNVLVIGESGTGKELVARMLHDTGPLKGRPFVPVNCGAIPENLIESEMFGHRKGSFTGAVSDKAGLFEAANGGTLFLDEVGELPLAMQVKLLRAIQERVFRKVGGVDDIRVDLRIIAATNRDLEAAVKAGTFREDLYYRLNVILIKTPPLRARRGDVMLLARQFLERFSARAGKAVTTFHPAAAAALEAYSWPGNVRELENVIERAVTLENDDQVSPGSLTPALQKAAEQLMGTDAAQAVTDAGPEQHSRSASSITLPAPDFSKGPLELDRILAEVERIYLLAALRHAQGVKKQAAELLGVTFRSMRYRLKKQGVDAGDDSEQD